MLWIKIKKNNTNLDKDLYLAAIYNSPNNSSYNKKETTHFFDILQDKMTEFSPTDYIIIGGDFNSRTGTLTDYATDHEKDSNFLNLPNDYELDKFTRTRNNQDIHTNSYGEKLIDFTISTKMRILNGRTIGDFIGKFTYIGHRGVSVIDYVLASENFLLKNYIHSFTVEDLTEISDHRPITLQLKYKINVINNPTIEQTLFSKPKRFQIKNFLSYREELNNEMNPQTINQLIKKIENSNKISDIDDIILQTTKFYTKSIKPNIKSNQRKKKNQIKPKKIKQFWYDTECKILKRQLNHLNKSVNRNPTDQTKRNNFFNLQKRYKKLLKHKRRTYEEGIINKMENLYYQNKDDFWKILKSMRRNDSTNEDIIPIDKLNNHFKKLYNKEAYYEYPEQGTELPTQTQIFDTLNENIKDDEVKEAIKHLKSKKSPGYDQITNEMIKCTNSPGIELITKIFNKILNMGYFPQEWNYGLIRVIHKGLDTHDINNYRGITLNSCLGKLFCSILYNRLDPLLEKENIYCKEQAGFRKNYRTSDHIFLLRSIIKEHISQNKILYTCFVDFSKAFDSICRKALIDKIHKLGINGKFLLMIKSIYDTTTNSIIYKDYIGETFTSNTGVKQGDTLSTILFNLYINDIPNTITSAENDPISLGYTTPLSCLKYADDLVIMSTSKDGLQKCLNKLESYCDKWKLEINTKKTKIILFNKQGSLIKKHKFTFKQKNIENVREYKYLGFIFSCSNSTNAGISNLINQGKKAWFSIQYYISRSKHRNIDTYLNLFDSLIKPILLYGCEAWADSVKTDGDISNLLQRNKLEKFHIKICKQILAVSRKTTNISVLLELGRYPITTYMKHQTIKYFLRFPQLNNERILYKYYINEVENHNNGKINFVSYITNILNNIGMSNIWIKQFKNLNQNEQENKVNMKNILVRLTDIFSQTSIDTIQNTNNSKLHFLNYFKKVFKIENYLKINNFENRRALTKLRTSSHTLAIETGRWTKTERTHRLCEQCTENKIEDETHFLFDCKKYSNERNVTFLNIKQKTGLNLHNQQNRINNLKLLFETNNIAALNALGKFTKLSFEKREPMI